MKGMRLNAMDSVSSVEAIYESCDDSAMTVPEQALGRCRSRRDDSAIKYLETRDKRQENTLEAPPLPRPRPEEFANVWNSGRGSLPKVETFTDGRRKKVRARIRSGLTLERFAQAVECCRTKPFLMGDNDRGWTATFDWLIANSENVEKAITNFGGKKGNGGQIGKGDRNLAAVNEALAGTGFSVDNLSVGGDGDSEAGDRGRFDFSNFLPPPHERAV
jgi:hypothetical protein